MSGEIEAGGALATATILSKTLERGGEGKPHADHGPCANCSATVDGAYCSTCGQPAHVHRTLGHFVEEAIHGVFHFDSRAWRTLPMLVFRPGTLTRDYTMGARARFISPVALFLFTIFLMFFVFAVAGGGPVELNRPTLSELRQNVAEAEARVENAQSELAAIRAELSAGASEPGNARIGARAKDGALALAQASLEGAQGLLDSRLRRLRAVEARIADLQGARDQLLKNREAAAQTNDTIERDAIGYSLSRIEEALADPAGPPDGINVKIAEDGGVSTDFTLTTGGASSIFQEVREANARGDINVNTGSKSIDKKIREKIENPELAWYKVQNTAYKFSFLLVPISLPFVWMMFAWKKGVTLFDHSVFVLYSLSFMSMLFILVTLLGRGPSWLTEAVLPLLALAIPAHMFFQLKGGYKLGWFSALWRTIVLLLAAWGALVLFLFAILALGLLG